MTTETTASVWSAVSRYVRCNLQVESSIKQENPVLSDESIRVSHYVFFSLSLGVTAEKLNRDHG